MRNRFSHSHRYTAQTVALMLAFLSMAPDASAQGATWTVAATPSIRLGTGQSEAGVLAAVAGATRLPNGNVLVGDRSAFSLIEFAPNGNVVRKYGRKGKGPGEVTYLLSLMRCGDSLVVQDLDGQRVHVFNLDAQWVRGFRFKRQPYRSACNRDMRVIMYGWESAQSTKEGLYRALVPYMISRADSTELSSLGELAGSERFGSRNGSRPFPLGREPRVAIGASRAYVALADSFMIRVFGIDGKPLPSLTAKVPRVAATPADLDAEKEREVQMMGESARKTLDVDYKKIPLADYLPATRDLVVDRDDNLWVQHYPRASQTTVTWTVFSPTGKLLASVALPTVFELYEVGRDYVLGRYVDPDESVPEVRLYALKRK